jgi:hypothetical protein
MVDVKIEKPLQRVKEKSYITHSIKRRNFDWIGHIMLLLSNARYKGKVVGMGRREGRRKQLLDDVRERRRYWN